MIKKNLGFSLIEVLGALAIGGLMSIGLSAIINASMEDTKGQQAAYFQAQVTAAAAKYVSTNYGVLSTAATDTAPVVIQLSDLQNASMLSANIGSENPYGQTPCVLVLKTIRNAKSLLHVLVVTEGGNTPIDDVNIGSIAAKSGQGGGYISLAAPTIARGAYNSWSISASTTPTLASFLSKNCSGTPAAGGHLASALFFDGPDQVPADYLYRNAVSGRPEYNQMQTPIHMDPTSDAKAIEGDTTDTRCTATSGAGKIAVNNQGQILNCQGGTWTRLGSGSWKEPRDKVVDLPVTGNSEGDVRMLTSVGRAYTWYKGQWVALGIDADGNMVVPKTLTTQTLVANSIQLNGVVQKDTPCSVSGAAAKANNGQLLTCQNGLWQSQSSLEVSESWTVCLRLRPSKYGDQTWPPCPDIYPQDAITYNSTVDTYAADGFIALNPTKNGIVALLSTSDINRTLISNPNVMGQLQLQLDLFDNDTGEVIGTSRSMTPALKNESASVNTTLIKAIVPNTNGYTLRVRNAWSFFTGPQQWDEANFQTFTGQVVQQTPLVSRVSIDVFY